MPTQAITPQRGHQEPVLGWGTLEAEGLGTLWLAWTRAGLRHLSFQRLQGVSAVPAPVPTLFAGPLQRYFAGQPEDFTRLPVDLRGTDFQLRVWNALRTIPWGEVRTYGGVANDVGSPRAMRAVGMANHVNSIPVIVPCHRVIEAGHRLGGYGGGIDRKRFLLELEGARVHEGIVQPGQLDLF